MIERVFRPWLEELKQRVPTKQKIREPNLKRQLRKISSSFGDSITSRSWCPFPSSTRRTIRWLSTAEIVSRTASEIRRPVA